MIKYYKLFDLLNRRGMNKSDLLEIISSKTIAKLSKGANLNTDIIDKICLFLNCQPSDIMEVIEIERLEYTNSRLINKNEIIDEVTDKTIQTMYGETIDFDENEMKKKKKRIKLAETKVDIKRK